MGDRAVGEDQLFLRRTERSQTPHLGLDQRRRIARSVGDEIAHGAHDVVVGHAATPRSARVITRGRRLARSPASTARATPGSTLITASTGTPMACSMSRVAEPAARFVDEDHPGGSHAAAHRPTQRQVARPGHEQRPVGARGERFGRDAGPDVDRDVAAPLVRPVVEPVAERRPAHIVIVDTVSSRRLLPWRIATAGARRGDRCRRGVRRGDRPTCRSPATRRPLGGRVRAGRGRRATPRRDRRAVMDVANSARVRLRRRWFRCRPWRPSRV